MKGKIVVIRGIVIDMQFPLNQMPAITDAVLTTTQNAEGNPVTIEVLQHLEDGVVRGIAMQTTDGLTRGTEVVGQGSPISVPVGDCVLGRIFNVLGEVVDGGDDVKPTEKWSIYRNPPAFHELSSAVSILET